METQKIQITSVYGRREMYFKREVGYKTFSRPPLLKTIIVKPES